MSNYNSSSNNTSNQAVDAHNNSNNKVNNGCTTYSASSDNSSQISANSDNDSSYSANSSSNQNNNNNNQSNHNEDEAQTDAMSFFNETLDLSHEDIQRTLIANMPYNNNNAGGATATVSVGAATSAVAAAATVVVAATTVSQQEEQPQESTDEDTADVFANLDAFDMLVEFPELDLDDKQALSNTALEQEQQQAHHAAAAVAAAQQSQRKLHQICDFSPEWSYTEGGVKVLVAGPWTSDGGCYTVLFDAQPVPTVLVQEGVLRCYCPAHEAGVVTLQVACGGFLVSNSAMFEYKLSLLADAPFDASSSNDCLYKFTLLNRLSTIDEKLQLKVENELAVSV